MTYALNMILEIALQTAVLALFLGSILSLFAGLGLLLGGGWVMRLNERTKRWVSTRQAMRPLDDSRSLEKYFYRWNVVTGLLLAIGAAFVLYFALFDYDFMAVMRLFRSSRLSIAIEIVVQACWLFIVVAAFAGLLIGVLLMIRPGALRAADGWMNHSYSGRKASKPLETMNYAPDGWIVSWPRLSGAVIAAGSLYVALVLGQLLWSGST